MAEEFKDIIAGLEQRIHLYKSKLQDLQKKQGKVEEEIKTVKKYLELAETLYRVEVEKARGYSSTSSTQAIEIQAYSNEFLLEKTKYSAFSIPQAAYLLLEEKRAALHVKEIYKSLIDGGVRIRSKTPETSIAVSLSRDGRFKKVAPNTFKCIDETDGEIKPRPEKNISPSGENHERG